MMYRRAALACAFVLACMAGPAYGQTNTTSTSQSGQGSSAEVPPVTVVQAPSGRARPGRKVARRRGVTPQSAVPVAQPVSNGALQMSQPAGISTILQNLAGQRATTSDTASLLADVPGASVQSAGGVSGLPVIDGLADDRLNVQVGGMSLKAACGNHMNPPMSYINPSQVGSIQVFPEIVPVSVGGDSVGGAILVNRPNPVFAAPGQRVIEEGDIGGYYRSNGNALGASLTATAATQNFSVTYTGSYAKSGNYDAGGKFKPAGPAYTAIPGISKPAPWLSGNEVGSTAYEAQDHNLAIAVRHDNSLLQLDLGVQNIPQQLYPNQRMDMVQNTGVHINLRDTTQYDWGVLKVQVYHQTVRHEMNFGEDKQYYYGNPATVLAPGMPMDTKGEDTGAKLEGDIDLSSRDVLKVGGELQFFDYNDRWPPSPSVLPPGQSGMMSPNTFWSIHNGRRDRVDAFAEWDRHWNSKWMTQLGVRSDTVMMDTGKVQGYNAMYDMMPLYPATTFNNADRSRTDQNWDATAMATYTPSDTQTYSFGYSQKSRSPNLYERYAWSTNKMAMEMIGWFGDGNYYVGNLNLDPEVAHTVSGTANWHDPSGRMGLQVTPYYTYISNFIGVRRCPTSVCGSSQAVIDSLTAKQGFVYLQFVNHDARLFGVDLSGHAVLAENTRWGTFVAKGRFSYVNGKDVTTGDNLYEMMPVNATLDLQQHIGRWTNTIETQLVGAKTQVSHVRNEVKTGAYALLNLHSTYEWGRFRIDFGLNNVFNAFYDLPLGGAYLGQGATMSGSGVPWGVPLPGMGRSFYVATNVKF